VEWLDHVRDQLIQYYFLRAGAQRHARRPAGLFRLLMLSLRTLAVLCLSSALASCNGSKPSGAADSAAAAVARDTNGVPFAYERVSLDTSRTPGTIIDSVFPMPEMIARFRTGLPQLAAMQGGELSRQALVSRFVAALAASDKTALGQLAISRAEFAYLYFPNSSDAAMPNGLPPQRRWDQINLRSEKGIGRALTRLGGKPLTLDSFDCPNPPVTTGLMTLHDGCTVRLHRADGEKFAGPLFGSILEYAGRFKFVGYANDM
jgi:hypothetical protein